MELIFQYVFVPLGEPGISALFQNIKKSYEFYTVWEKSQDRDGMQHIVTFDTLWAHDILLPWVIVSSSMYHSGKNECVNPIPILSPFLYTILYPISFLKRE